MNNKDTSLITSPEKGEVQVFLKPGRELANCREAIRDLLKSSFEKNRICGYDDQWIKGGRIIVYYNPLNSNGGAASAVAKKIVEAYNKEMN